MAGNNSGGRTIEKQGQSSMTLPAARTPQTLGGFCQDQNLSRMRKGLKKTARRIHGPHGPRF